MTEKCCGWCHQHNYPFSLSGNVTFFFFFSRVSVFYNHHEDRKLVIYGCKGRLWWHTTVHYVQGKYECINMQLNHVKMQESLRKIVKFRIIQSICNIIMFTFKINQSLVNIIILHVRIIMLHVRIIMLHIILNMCHVYTDKLHVYILKLHVYILMLHVYILMLHVNMIYFERRVRRTCHHRKVIEQRVNFILRVRGGGTT